MNTANGSFLIVDDEPEMCWVIERILKGVGGLCQLALNATEALAFAERQSFHVAFLDAKLPSLDGLGLAVRLREIAPDIRIVLVSGYFYKDDPAIAEALRSGLISAFIAKPFLHAEILSTIESLHLPQETGNNHPSCTETLP